MSQNIKIKINQKIDAALILELYKEAGWWYNSDNIKYNKNKNYIKKIINGSFCFAVAYFNKQIAGIGRCISDGVSDAYIQDVFVKKEFRNKGIANLIVHNIILYLKNKNINWIALIAVPKTDTVYKNNGFKLMRNHKPFLLEIGE